MATLVVIEDLAGPASIARGGQAVYVLQWLHGLERLGHQVLFIEFLTADPGRQRAAIIKYFNESIESWWHRELAALIVVPTGESLSGLQASQIKQFARRADALITLAAHYRREPFPFVEKIRPRILVEQDPGYTHLWAANEQNPAEVWGEHDVYFTVGQNIGTERCRLPTLGVKWHPILPPVVLKEWAGAVPITRDRFTTIADWRGYGYLEFEGKTLGPKAEEFRKFIKLPRLAGEPLELTLMIDRDDPDNAYLKRNGWRIESPKLVATPTLFKAYVSGSVGEFSCAKGGYVGTHSGWFSDRSAYYLAAGRPVIVQATGFEDVLPAGKGLLAVRNVEEAAEAINAVRAGYEKHSRAARALAHAHFDSDKVLGRMLAESGIPN